MLLFYLFKPCWIIGNVRFPSSHKRPSTHCLFYLDQTAFQDAKPQPYHFVFFLHKRSVNSIAKLNLCKSKNINWKWTQFFASSYDMRDKISDSSRLRWVSATWFIVWIAVIALYIQSCSACSAIFSWNAASVFALSQRKLLNPMHSVLKKYKKAYQGRFM